MTVSELHCEKYGAAVGSFADSVVYFSYNHVNTVGPQKGVCTYMLGQVQGCVKIEQLILIIKNIYIYI